MNIATWIHNVSKSLGYKDPLARTHWDDNVIKFACTKVDKGKIVLLGDSITEGWKTTKYMDSCLNYGIAGDMTNGTLGFIEHVLRVEPSKVILNIGTNDIGFEVSQLVTETNYRNIVTRLSRIIPSKNIICCAIRPINNMLSMAHGRNNIIIKSYNGMISNICRDRELTFEPETYSCNVITTMNLDFLNPTRTIDGLHLNDEGYKYEFEILKKYLD